eukprot:m.240864 g.240864  ORF g.240864 m.240864 type:complete len:54 (+) comp40197_c1_seq20:1657-1818(+)
MPSSCMQLPLEEKSSCQSCLVEDIHISSWGECMREEDMCGPPVSVTGGSFLSL